MKYIAKYGYVPNPERIADALKSISAAIDGFLTPDVLRKCFGLMDLTTLHDNDTPASVKKLVDKANRVHTEFPDYPLPASVCVFPNFAGVVKECRASKDLHVTAVSGCFPTSQSFLEVKVRECELAVEAGADEIDIVLALNSFLADDEQAAFDEICAMRKAIDAVAASQGRKVILKVILETGLLVTEERIAEASFLAMEAGADFIKTSTGKVDVNATPTAAYIMCDCIRLFEKVTGKKVGFKAAGGISTAKDAVCYYLIVESLLGKEYLCKDYFRFGVSRLGNALMSEAEQNTITFF